MEDTIAAIATAPAPAGVGIIRISGGGAVEIADRVFAGKRNVKLKDRAAFTVSYGHILDRKGRTFDEALALVMRQPHSYTGEDVIELQCHGGSVVLQQVLELVLQAGARMAEPGEFSKRAFLNGRLDLSQAEAIMDLITSKTGAAAQTAMGNLQGNISERVRTIAGGIMEVMAYLEADIDFPEEDFLRLNEQEVAERLSRLEADMETLLRTYQGGRIMREGLKTVLAGRPNAGKSSLLNTILQEERAIVTDIPGTTRDTIEEYYNLGGIPLLLIDTAGIRETSDKIEKIGVARTRELVAAADIVLYVIDIMEGVQADDLAFLRGLPSQKVLVLFNKIDIKGMEQKEADCREKLADYQVLFISALESTGIAELEKAIARKFFAQGELDTRQAILTNVRQKDKIEKALAAVTNAREALQNGVPADLADIDLKQALLYLGEVTGETVSEDIIDEIFARFCLGK